VQYTAPSATGFRTCIAKPIGPTLNICDIQQGALSRAQLEGVIATILAHHADDTLRIIAIANLSPGVSFHDAEKLLAVERFDLFCPIIRRWASASGRQLQNAYLDLKQGMFCAVFHLR
jgi:hypothetical protein